MPRNAVSKQFTGDIIQDCAVRTMIVEPPALDPDRVTAILDADKPKYGRTTSSNRAAGAKQIGRIAGPRENAIA
jgi:hypothetical protein